MELEITMAPQFGHLMVSGAASVVTVERPAACHFDGKRQPKWHCGNIRGSGSRLAVAEVPTSPPQLVFSTPNSLPRIRK